jgi:glycosyltransferase involved in cell wall biosynthesis
MSVLNAEQTLRPAIASLRAQTYEDWELLILDDSSVDRSAEIAAQAAAGDERIRAIEGGARNGLAVRLNELLDAARSPLFARMDADDIAYPERLERQVAYLESHPEVDLVGSSMLVFGVGGIALGKQSVPVDHDAICARPASRFRALHPTWVGRLDWFRRYRYAPEALRWEDQDLLYRSYRSSVFANLSEPLLGYREQRLVLQNLLLGRLNRVRVTRRRSWPEGRRVQALAAVGEQFAKGCLDAVAVATGLDHRLLRQRARPLSESERAKWSEVWAAVEGGALSEQ